MAVIGLDFNDRAACLDAESNAPGLIQVDHSKGFSKLIRTAITRDSDSG
jgi:hypothetical protein